MDVQLLRKAVTPAIAGVAGLSVGGVVGYIVATRRAKRQFLHLVEESEASLRAHSRHEIMQRYAQHDVEQTEAVQQGYPPRLWETGVDIDRERIVDTSERVPYYQAHKSPVELQRFVEHDVQVVKEADPELEALLDEEEQAIAEASKRPPVKNVFIDGKLYDASDDDWDWEAELSMRSDKTIYVITREEFDADDMGYGQSTANWFEGDRMLSDENGDAIYNWTSHIGTELPFGHGSGDENVLFVRNENLRWEYCVCKNPGRFDQEVEGHEIELDYEEQDLKHSKQPLKMRRE
jgi:hypothetical protein